TSCLLAMTIALIGFIFLIGGCGKKSVGEKSGEKIEKTVRAEVGDRSKEEIDIKHKVHGFKLEGFTKTGENQWYIEGDFAKIIDKDIILNSIKGESFGKDISVILTADKGIYNRGSGLTELNGNVIVTTSDGGKVSMDFARWDAKKGEIETDSHVIIEHGGIMLEGRGALVRPKQKWAMLEKEIKVRDASNRVITCDGPLEVDYGKREAVFNNNVQILDTEGRMSANKLVAYFDPDTRTIERIEWIGDVECIY
ncbi:MAG: LPS export ABC transporter periplasmic protein LptC, partial [Candidatus Omnitrophica bacterium]|nr:LPS export ABC transporter periplasmic protein LptC [Candidatus Omnitrophota bacterium]